MSIARVLVTDDAIKVINKLQEEHGELMFHQSGGCCDGSQPMCYAKGEFRVGSSDVCLGRIENCDFYMSADQYEYWKYTQLTIDAAPGRGASFALEIPLGVRFITRSRMFSEEEYAQLDPIVNCESE